MVDSLSPRTTTADGVPVWCNYDALLDPAELLDYPDNPNTHPVEQIAAIRAVITENGWREAIVVSKLSGRITKGHGRKLAALRGEPWKQVPVEYQDYAAEDAERADVVADNALAQKSKQDAEALRRFLSSVDFETEKTERFALSNDELQQIISAPERKFGENDPDVEWQGMPEFHNEPDAVRTLFVHFVRAQDVSDFQGLIGQRLTDKTKFIWFPKKE